MTRPSDRIIFRKAVATDIKTIENIYNEVHQAEEKGIISVGWERGVYPVRATAEEALKRDDLFVLEYNGIVSGAGMINKIQVDVYLEAPWEYDAEDEDICVLHTLVISPRVFGKGLGTRFVRFYEEYAKKHGCSELRLDTNERNKAARSMYAKLGYKEISTVPTTFNGIPGVDLVLLEKTISFPSTGCKKKN